MQLFGTSGIRRVADKELIQLALKVGLAVGKVNPSVVVGCDTRTSSQAMKHALLSGLLSAGARCHDAGVIPLPTLAHAARGFNAGAMITASHNPPEYNGIKLLNPDGSAFDSSQRREIEEIVSDGSFAVAPWDEIKGGSIYEGAIGEHIAGILRHFPDGLKLRVVALNCCPSGFFPHSIEQLADSVITVPKVDAIFSPVVNTVALQLLAYYTAKYRGCPIDTPRNLAKSVTVE